MSSPHFKMKDMRTVCKLVQANDFLATIDLKDAYFTIPIHKKSKSFFEVFI